MSLTRTEKSLIDLMADVGLSKKTAVIVIKYLKEKKQQKAMINYIKEHQDYITDHQTIQHLAKMIVREEEN